MKLIYSKGLNKVEMYDLQIWFKCYIKENNSELLSKEHILVKIDTKEKNLISVRIDESFNVWIYLYIDGMYVKWAKFEYSELKGIDISFIKLLSELKKHFKLIKSI